MSWNTTFARIGAVFYVLWGLAHYNAAYGVYQFAQSTITIEHGRLEQLAFYLASFATAGIVFATTLNWRNNRLGFWCNAVTIGIGDIPFILFVLIPGYVPIWPGIMGPVLWIAGVACTAIAQTSTSETVGDIAWAKTRV